MKRLIYVWFVCVVSVAAAAAAAPMYNIVPLGLDDPEHTYSDGSKYGFAYELNEAGQVSGYAQRYNGGSADLGSSVWLYDGATTFDIGLTGPEHTRNDGYKYSYAGDSISTAAGHLNEAGQVSGFSRRYNGGSIDLGYSAWLYDGATTIDIGFTGTEHTRNDGYKYSLVQQLNEAGKVIGLSNRYNGGSRNRGQTAWLYNGATTIDIGLTGNEHTSSTGYKASSALQLNEAGQVRGQSTRFNGSFDGGYSAWLYNGATTIDIGLTGPEYTSSSGLKRSYTKGLNEAGQVIGYSERRNGGDLGQSAWLYDGATTIQLGFTGAEYTNFDGYKYSEAQQLNEAGQVRGISYRYNGGSASLAQSAWLYDGTSTIEIGLTGPEYTSSGGYKSSYASQLNEAGQVSGTTVRYNGGGNKSNLGYSAWLYDGTAYIQIGLTGPEFTRNDGYKGSSPNQLNQAGQVVGGSNRYSGGSTLLGYSAWLYDGATTTNIGLTDAVHTRNDGYKESFTSQLNEEGQVLGYSYRYNGGSTQLGQDAWFYDPTLDQTFKLQLSTRSDGYAYSGAPYLGQDGLVLGTYTLFDALDTNLGERAFSFTTADGLHDLGFFVDGGLPANGWDSLAIALRANGPGQILGYGTLTSGGQMAYLLTPAVPEPSTFILAAIGLIGLVMFRPRRAT